MGEKMGYLFGSGMASLGHMRPETLKGFEEVAKEMAKAEGVPVESTMKMGAQATGSDSNAASPGASQPCPAQTQQQQLKPDVGAAVAGAALSRLGLGGLGRSRSTGDVFLLTAPAGYGKTTLLVQWAKGRSVPVAWYRLDAGDDLFVLDVHASSPTRCSGCASAGRRLPPRLRR